MGLANRQKVIDAEACEWLLLKQERQLTAVEQEDLSQWLNIDESHRTSFSELEKVWAGIGTLNGSEELAKMRSSEQENSFLDKITSLFRFDSLALPQLGGGLAVAMLLAVFVISPMMQTGDAVQTFRTEVSQTQELTLDDGSRVTLGANSEIQVSFVDDKRHVDLNRGQAFFKVAKDASRPFYVATNSATIRVVGTRFDVRRNNDNIKVSVEEGIVEVVRRAKRVSPGVPVSDQKTLTAGQQLNVTRHAMGEVELVDSSAVATWRDGRLVYRNARLSEVIADANRYRDGTITLGAKHLEDLQVTTSYSVDQVDTMVLMLEQSLPLVVHREADGRIVILPKP